VWGHTRSPCRKFLFCQLGAWTAVPVPLSPLPIQANGPPSWPLIDLTYSYIFTTKRFFLIAALVQRLYFGRGAVEKVKLSLCLTNLVILHEGVWESGCIDPHFLHLGTSWRRVVSFTPRPLYPLYPLYRRLGKPQSRSGRRGEEKILHPTGTWTPTPWSSSP
jgi:hypothetical protein